MCQKLKVKIPFLILSFFVTITLSSAQFNNPKNLAFQWETDTLKSIIELNEITIVLPRGSFSKIDYPVFIGKQEGMKSFYKHEPVISIEIKGKAKAYPLNMLTMHEMSNDTLAGAAILPTYCPLCNSSLVFNRKIKDLEGNEQILEFEVSGMLRHSDMIMGDKQSATLWQQLTGEGIVGKFSGKELEILPSQVISVEEFFTNFPEGMILSPKTETDAEEYYGKNPYESYDDLSGKPYERFFDSTKIDRRLPPMERILNIQAIDKYRIYPFSVLERKKVINDHFEGTDLVLFYTLGTISILDKKEIKDSRKVGSATAFYSSIEGKKLKFYEKKGFFFDKESNSKWSISGTCIDGPMEGKKLQKMVHSNHFAFAWLNFHPESEIYQED